MLILLPPSEKKATATEGPALDLAALGHPELTATRERVLAALQETSRRPDARDVLALPAGQAEEALRRNLALREAPTLPAAELYTGVLYDNLDLPSLDPAAAGERILVFSGLWGALRLTDRIPPYRLSMAASLPRHGRLSTLWRPALTEALRPDGLIVDMRSGPYAAAWKAPGAVAVRVFRERVVAGVAKRTVVSHMAKATRGEIAHALIASGARPRTPEQLLKTVAGLGYAAELNGPNLDIVLPG
ncbi:YaaA family protein [Spirillospora albida]|uniref:YaaA family protein n=1 Tax=Spirillospora albida TaxID=58123 RepID=UPI0004BE70B3|nr:peroxide stress protein YaaA [Spirillospora albida]